MIQGFKLASRMNDFKDILISQEELLDEDSQLVLWEIALYIENELEEYRESSDEEQAHCIWMLHLLFHSNFDEFSEYFRGYYASPDNQLHQLYIDEGITTKELYQFLEDIDWHLIYKVCRSESNHEKVSNIFRDETRLDYSRERQKYPVQPWDGTPRWLMADGKYIESQ